jgi:hypothetical protein
MDTDPKSAQLPVNLPLVLLASDEPRLASHLHLALCEQHLVVEFAPGYAEIESLAAEAHRKAIVLLEVSRHQSVEAAVELALRIKRGDASRFVGYVADRILHNSGLTGDALLTRNARDIQVALHAYFQKRI